MVKEAFENRVAKRLQQRQVEIAALQQDNKRSPAKRLDIFPSEGGYRLCLATWGANYNINRSPWYSTLDEALSARKIEFDKMDRSWIGETMFHDGFTPDRVWEDEWEREYVVRCSKFGIEPYSMA